MKKIKDYFPIILLVIVGILFVISFPVKADSGFDFDYDSGGSDFGGSSFGDYSSVYSGSGNGSFELGNLSLLNVFLSIIVIIYFVKVINRYGNKNNEFITRIFLLLATSFSLDFISFIVTDIINIFINIFALCYIFKFNKKTKDEYMKKLTDNKLTLEEITNKLGKDFNYEKFKKLVFDNYKEIQIAWMNNDIESVRSLLSDTLFNTYKTELLTLEMKNEQNIMEDIEYVDCFIKNINLTKQKEEIEVNLIVTCTDYIINKSTNKVLRGNKRQTNKYYYKLVFEKDSEEDLRICPNCGATLKDGSSTKCEYCKSIIIKKSKSYILTDKKMLKQEIVKRIT